MHIIIIVDQIDMEMPVVQELFDKRNQAALCCSEHRLFLSYVRGSNVRIDAKVSNDMLEIVANGTILYQTIPSRSDFPCLLALSHIAERHLKEKVAKGIDTFKFNNRPFIIDRSLQYNYQGHWLILSRDPCISVCRIGGAPIISLIKNFKSSACTQLSELENGLIASCNPKA